MQRFCKIPKGLNMELSVVIPVYNEEKIIEKTIEKVLDATQKITKDFELIISDDFSKDRTVEIVKNYSKIEPRVRVLETAANKGRGEAVSAGFLQSKGKYLIFMDADLSTDLKHLKEMIEYLHDYDVVTGSRHMMGSLVKRSAKRNFTSKMYSIFIRSLFGSKILDHECGFKGFKKSVALKLVDECGIKEKNSRGVAWDTEILVRAQRNGYKIKEFPVEWIEGEKSEIKLLREGFKLGKYMLKLRAKFLFGR